MRSPWWLIAVAVVAEVSGSLALEAALHNRWWYVLVVIGYLAGFVLLGAVLRRGLPLGVVYAVWGSCGVALTAILGTVLFAERMTPVSALGIVLIVAGVAVVESSRRAHNSTDPR